MVRASQHWRPAMRAILIDPFTKVLAETEVTPGLPGIRDAIGCDLVTAIPLRDGSGDVVYLDDEGLSVEGQAWFVLDGHPQPYAGKGLVLGTVGEGRDGPVTVSAREVLAMVRWMDRLAVAVAAEDGCFDCHITDAEGIAVIPVRPEDANDGTDFRGLRDATAYLAREAKAMGLTEVAALLTEAAKRIRVD